MKLCIVQLEGDEYAIYHRSSLLFKGTLDECLAYRNQKGSS